VSRISCSSSFQSQSTPPSTGLVVLMPRPFPKPATINFSHLFFKIVVVPLPHSLIPLPTSLVMFGMVDLNTWPAEGFFSLLFNPFQICDLVRFLRGGLFLFPPHQPLFFPFFAPYQPLNQLSSSFALQPPSFPPLLLPARIPQLPDLIRERVPERVSLSSFHKESPPYALSSVLDH